MIAAQQSSPGDGRARATGRKVVHAFADGYLVPWSLAQRSFRSATYNPYRTDTFVDRETGAPVTEPVRYIALNGEGAWYIATVELDEIGAWYASKPAGFDFGD